MERNISEIEHMHSIAISESIGQMIKINNNPVEFISNFMIEGKVIDFEVIKTIKSKSEEGCFFSGTKMIVYIKLVQKLIYSTNNNVNSVHSYNYETFKSIIVHLPESINDKPASELKKLSKTKIKITPSIKSKKARKISSCDIFTSAVLCLDVDIYN